MAMSDREWERRVWLDGYESAIRYIYATADQEPEILQGFMDRAELVVDSEMASLAKGYGRGADDNG